MPVTVQAFPAAFLHNIIQSFHVGRDYGKRKMFVFWNSG